MDGPYLNVLQIELLGQKWPTKGSPEHGQFLINTYRLKVLNKNSGEQSRVTWPSFIGWPRTLENRENRENGQKKISAGKNQGI